jgi:hypothetical protein
MNLYFFTGRGNLLSYIGDAFLLFVAPGFIGQISRLADLHAQHPQGRKPEMVCVAPLRAATGALFFGYVRLV